MMAFSGAFRSFLKVYAAVAVCALLAVVVSRYDFGLHLRPRVLYAGVAGIHYNEKLCVSDSSISIASFEVEEGALPEGFQLKHVRGQRCALLEGTTMRAGRHYFTVRAKEAAIVFGRRGSVSYLLQIAQPMPPPPAPPKI